jgi:hypothetical protein
MMRPALNHRPRALAHVQARAVTNHDAGPLATAQLPWVYLAASKERGRVKCMALG